MRRQPLGFVALLGGALALGCGSSPNRRPAEATPAHCTDPFGWHARFEVDRATLAAREGSQSLLGKVDRSAYKYFRLLGSEMGARTCESLRDLRWHLPLSAIHGDAHVEQFVVTGETAGLEDFDQAGYGPSAVDLVRYAASLHLACREVSFACDADAAVEVFFHAYRDAIDRPPDATLVPSIVARLRGSTPQDRVAWLAWAESIMIPLPPNTEAFIRRRWSGFEQLVAELQPERPPAFAHIVKVGGLEMGIGSMFERKVLVRIAGESDAPEDDFILEARAAPASSGRNCAWRPPHGGSLHALLMMSVLGRRMPEVYGFGSLGEQEGAPEYWVQSWVPGYRELSIRDLQTQAELDELAADAARQLAGHTWTRFPEALRVPQRLAQLHAFDLVSERARRLAKDFAHEVVEAWQRFRRGGSAS